MIGQTISHFHILEKIGEGGMGVVYKAEDTNLKRTVALKFLPRGLEAHEPEQARFLQEAQAASAINHPNVCTIYEISQHEGQQFIVMEYVDGKTLRQMVPIQKTQIAIDYAIQIGEALQEAHSKGIVHRDIKTDNIMVNSKNQIKVMDFGLAKLKGSLKLTRTSSTVGTLAYMAPEQIQGGEVDARSDIFSFGVVLYEMLTGHLPFRGEHEAAMVYSIVNEAALPIEKYLPDVSSELVHVINRALEKDPEDRYQYVHDMVIDLRRLKKQTSRVSRVLDGSSEIAGREITPSEKKRNVRNFAVVGVAGTMILAVVLVVLFLKPSVKLNSNMKMKVLDIPFTEIQYPGLSPDGKWLAFPAADANGKWDIYNMSVSGGEPKRITEDSAAILDAYNANFSPDGSLITYGSRNEKTGMCEIRIVSSLGGPSKVISAIGISPKWRPDGQRIGYCRVPFDPSAESTSRWKEFWTVSPNGANEKLEFIDSLGMRQANYCFSWSPDGKSIAWLRTFKELTQEIVVRDFGTGKERQVTHEGHNIDEVCWTANDRIIYSSSKAGSTTLWMIPAAGGESVQITKEGPDMGMTVSADCRKLVFYRKRTLGFIWRAGIDGSNPKQLTFDGRPVGSVQFSPDRKRIIFAGGGDEFGFWSGVYLIDRDGHNRQELVPTTEDAANPVWSPDGKWIAYSSQGANTPIDSLRVLLLDASNLGPRKQIAKGFSWRWVDSRTLLVYRGARTWQFDIFTKEERPFFEDSTWAIPVVGQQYIAYIDGSSRMSGLWILPSNYRSERSVKPRLLFHNEPYTVAYPDAESMFMLWDNQGTLWRMLLPSGKRERIPGKFPGLTRASFLNVSYDGKEIVYVQRRLDTKLLMIDNLFE
jgi:serine/threonine protein kinase